MRPIDEFELQPVSLPGRAPRARLVRGGTPLLAEVDGATLEAQFEVDGRYLLFVTDDCPYEEMLHIVLLDEQLRRLDLLRLGAPYSPGVFRAVDTEGERHVSFAFTADATRYRLTVHPRRRWPRRRYMELRPA